MAYQPISPEVGSALNATIVTGEAEFYPSSLAAGIKIGNIRMHKNAGKATTKDRQVSVRGGGRRLAARVTTLAELVYDIEADEQTLENMALVLFGTATQSGYTQAAQTAPAGTATISSSLQRSVYDLGKLNVTTVVVKQGATVYVENTDYSVDYQRGTVYIIDGGGIANGTALSIPFGNGAVTMDTIQALTTLNRTGRFVLYESDLESATLFKRIWDGSAMITATAYPEENADFSHFQYSVTFTGQPTIKQRQYVAS